MGRGRAKAKQTKVARELKYNSHEPDFNKLQQELANSDDERDHRSDDPADESDDYDSWASSPR